MFCRKFFPIINIHNGFKETHSDTAGFSDLDFALIFKSIFNSFMYFMNFLHEAERRGYRSCLKNNLGNTETKVECEMARMFFIILPDFQTDTIMAV